MDSFTIKCIEELAQLRKTATTNELIMLQLTTLEEYVEWRRKFPDWEPWMFYLRPEAPDVIAIRKQYEQEILRSMIEKKLRE